MTEPSILSEAEQIINGPRRDSYGEASKSFSNIAKVWSVILDSDVSPQKVAMCMIALKLLRESNKPQRDNRVDIAGYVALLDNLETNGRLEGERME